MTIKSKYRGNDIIFVNDEWVFESTGLNTIETHNDMPCGRCNKLGTNEGHDACLGTLIGLMNACCGHGDDKEAYVQFLDGESIRGDDAVTIIDILKKYKK